jgi:hypothetical protein
MIELILIIIIIIVIYKIVIEYNSKKDTFINITNPFVDGLSQFQLGQDAPDEISVMDNSHLPNNSYDPYNPANNLITSTGVKPNKKKVLNKINELATIVNRTRNPKRIDDMNIVKAMRSNKSNSSALGVPCKQLNKFFMQTQFSDSYRDVLTAFNSVCPNQKIIFNLQSLPVTTTKYDPKSKPPFEFVKLITQFINKLNAEIKKLPESYEIVNDYNNYLPLTSQLKKYTEDKGINKFYKDIGVDYNLYADTPPNSPVELIKIISMTREYTEAETKYIITFVIKKILKSINDQLQITVHFVTKNDPLAAYNLFDGKPPTESINTSQQVAIEFIFTDGFYTNDFNIDYDCASPCDKQVSNIDGDDKYYSFDALRTTNFISDHDIIKEYNKINRQHEIEMNNFNINVPYPIYQNQDKAKPPSFPKDKFVKN